MPEPHAEPSAGRVDRLREAATRVVQLLHEAGHVAYFAGGCVRDMLRRVEPKDYDVATDAHPDQVKRIFRRTRLVGEAFGVVLVRMKGFEIEVATFRREWGYADGRRPDHVQYTNAEEDARRRDFTINGMFYDPLAEQVIDLVGGRSDLDRGVIRAIGRAEERFAEDYLRMLRAVRFAARLGFEIEQDTADAIATHAALLQGISRERIGMEMRAMLAAPTRGRAVSLIESFGLDIPVLNETSGHSGGATAEGRDEANAFDPLTPLTDDAEFVTALAAWALRRQLQLPDTRTLGEMVRAMRRLKPVQIRRRYRKAMVLSNDESEAFGGILLDLSKAMQWFDLDTAARKRLMARSHWSGLAELLGATVRTAGIEDFDLAAWAKQVEQLEAEGVAPDPLITGDDLIAAGLKPGPNFGRLLEQVYDAQLNGELTDRQAALEMALRQAPAE